ncbi:unnamed protein product [Rhodiola kirilowii]
MARKRKVDEEELTAPEVDAYEEEEEEKSSSEEEEEKEEEEEEESSEEDDDEVEVEVEEEEDDESSEEEKEDDESKKEHIRDLLQPFEKEKLIEILKEAASANPAIFKQLLDSAEADPVHRKIFVHGLSWEATSEHVSSAFRQFGKIEECRVVTDKLTGKSKGYGFVLFKTRSGAVKALKQPQKMIAGRMTACQLAAAGPASNANATVLNANASATVSFSTADMGSRKLHVKNVGPQVSVDRLRSFFSSFGEIEQGPLGVDKMTGKLRGFAIFVYKTLDGINKALEEPVKNFEGLKLECSVAREGKNSKANQNAAITVENVDVGSLIGSNVTSNAANPLYPYGFNPALFGASAFYTNQNPGLGIMNPLMGMSGSLRQIGLPTSFMGGMAQGVNKGTAPPVGSSSGIGSQQGVNAVSPSVIFNYGSQAALQGLGAFQGSRVSQSSASAKDLTSASGAGLGNLPYGR